MQPDVPSGPFRIGPYEALESLGRGGFASVYRARDLRTGGFVALKVVPPGTDPESVRRLMREARAVARVSHPNVVRVFECGVTAEGAYVAMELLVGRTLQDLIDEVGALPVPRTLQIAIQVLDGLGVAHEHKIVHRDVKPGNIFLTQDEAGQEVPHLLDFGVSKLGSTAAAGAAGPAGSPASLASHQDRTLPGTAMGTPGFMAPEQYGSAHAADARADVYGVAATIYTMLTGRLPFDAGTYESWVFKV
jgi:serine/threonine-protein kinase